MQIRYRLTLQFILIVACILVVALFFIHFQFKKNIENEFYENLRSKAMMTAEMVVGKFANETPPEMPTEESGNRFSGAYTENISIYNAEGKLIYSFNPLPYRITPSMMSGIKSSSEKCFERGKFKAIGILYSNRAGDKFVVVAEAVFNPGHLDNLTRILVWVFFISISLVAAGGWFFARQALAPVSRIMNQVDELLPSNLQHRLEQEGQSDELSRLVITFNKMLDRVEHAFKIQKMFLSNVSHELKNPLNVIVSQIEVSLDKDRTGEEYRQTLASVLSDVKELNQVADMLMQMARINAEESAIQFQAVRIDELIWQAKATLLKSNPDYRISFEVANLPENEEKLTVNANEQLLKTALINLLDNGCKFSPDRSVKARLSFCSKGLPTVEIQDNGPGIAEEEARLLFEPFFRSPRAASIKGSGVGLSLVDSIMKLHHIRLGLTSKQGLGSTFSLVFPEEPQNAA